jgi:cobalt-zinc-cadmium resistance protein CzcA
VDGTPVYIRDVAEVKIGPEVRAGALVKNGDHRIGGRCGDDDPRRQRQGGGSRIKDRVAEINAKGMLPDGLKIKFLLRPLRAGGCRHPHGGQGADRRCDLRGRDSHHVPRRCAFRLVVVATLVLTPLLTFMVMNHYGLSANLMSLGGLAIAIGLMVDGSVVVVENAFARLGRENHGESGCGSSSTR